MTDSNVYIVGAGVISPFGCGLAATMEAVAENRSVIEPLRVFSPQQEPALPVGQIISTVATDGELPRTHQLAVLAAREATSGGNVQPDAIIIGTTTGGILTTEELLLQGITTKSKYRYHGLHTVAQEVARDLGCSGAAITVSTACSSGITAIALALAMLRNGRAETVLAGGVDSLSRLTYYGFFLLQLVDRNGCKPLDTNRQGMAVAEGAGLLLLSRKRPPGASIEVRGAGLSCDAYHAVTPHPEGRGALRAMQMALADAGLDPSAIDYINLHGTGTRENDRAECRAIRQLFPKLPALSSIKGGCGHSLAAAGGIGAVVSSLAISRGFLPANTGLLEVDPTLAVSPVLQPVSCPVRAVITNSFGFGGNNGSLILAKADCFPVLPPRKHDRKLAIHGLSCLTGAGATTATMQQLMGSQPVAGLVAAPLLAENLPSAQSRRLKRLSRMALSLAIRAMEDADGGSAIPSAVFAGTGWGALTDTFDFLSSLTESQEKFASPIDFVGSVHNAAAGQVAIMFGANGANITCAGGDYSFEESLLAAECLLEEPTESAIILGVDEAHQEFSALLDPSISGEARLVDGGGAILVNRQMVGAQAVVQLLHFSSGLSDEALDKFVDTLAQEPAWQSRVVLILAGIPAGLENVAERQLARFLSLTDLAVPVVRYRKLTGEFASASAVAVVHAAVMVRSAKVPGTLYGGPDCEFENTKDSVMVLGFGANLTAIRVSRPPSK